MGTKLYFSKLYRARYKTLLFLAKPAHLTGKKNGVLTTALMTQMEGDYSQHIVEDDTSKIRCILSTDTKSAFQSASRKHCYELLSSDNKLKEIFAAFFAKKHMKEREIYMACWETVFELSSGFTQGDINASRLYTFNTAALVSIQQAAIPVNRVVLALVDDII